MSGLLSGVALLMCLVPDNAAQCDQCIQLFSRPDSVSIGLQHHGRVRRQGLRQHDQRDESGVVRNRLINNDIASTTAPLEAAISLATFLNRKTSFHFDTSQQEHTSTTLKFLWISDQVKALPQINHGKEFIYFSTTCTYR
jgi:hypothetical protein